METLLGITGVIVTFLFVAVYLYTIIALIDERDNSSDSKNDNNNDKPSDNQNDNSNDLTDTEVSENTKEKTIDIKNLLNPSLDIDPKSFKSIEADLKRVKKLTVEFSHFMGSRENRGFAISLNDFPVHACAFAAGFGCEKECRESLGVDSDSSAFKIFAKYAKSFASTGNSGFPDEFYHTFGDALYVRFLCEKTEFYSHLKTPEFDKCKHDLDQILGTFKGIAKKIARVTPYPGFSYNSENSEMKRSLEDFINSSRNTIDHTIYVFNSLVDEHNVLTEKLIAEENRKDQEECAMKHKIIEDEIIATLSVGTSQLSSSAAERKDFNSPVW